MAIYVFFIFFQLLAFIQFVFDLFSVRSLVEVRKQVKENGCVEKVHEQEEGQLFTAVEEVADTMYEYEYELGQLNGGHILFPE